MVIASHALVCCEIFRLASYLFVAVLLKSKNHGQLLCVLPPMYCWDIFHSTLYWRTKSKKCHIVPSTIIVKVTSAILNLVCDMCSIEYVPVYRGLPKAYCLLSLFNVQLWIQLKLIWYFTATNVTAHISCESLFITIHQRYCQVIFLIVILKIF